MLYVAVLRGESPWDARPILATGDPEAVHVAIAAIVDLIERAGLEPCIDDPVAEVAPGGPRLSDQEDL